MNMNTADVTGQFHNELLSFDATVPHHENTSIGESCLYCWLSSQATRHNVALMVIASHQIHPSSRYYQ